MRKIFLIAIISFLLTPLSFYLPKVSANGNITLRELVCGTNTDEGTIYVRVRYPESITTDQSSFTVDVIGGDLIGGFNNFSIFPGARSTTDPSITITDEAVHDGDVTIFYDYLPPPGFDDRVTSFNDDGSPNNEVLGDDLFVIEFSASNLFVGGVLSISSDLEYTGGDGYTPCSGISINVVEGSQVGTRCNGQSNASFGIVDTDEGIIPIRGCLVEGEFAAIREYEDREESSTQIGNDTTILPTSLNGAGEFSTDFSWSVDDGDAYIRIVAINSSTNEERLLNDQMFFFDILSDDPVEEEDVRLEGCDLEEGSEPNTSCLNCINQGGIWLAIGCVDPTPLGIMTRLVQTGIGVMGGVALAQLIYAGVMFQSGNEAKIAEARKKAIASLTGVVVLVFSVLILRIIGVNVLDAVPGGFL